MAATCYTYLKRKEKKKNHLHVDLFVVFLPPGNFRREPVRRAQAGRHRHLQSKGIKKKKKSERKKKTMPLSISKDRCKEASTQAKPRETKTRQRIKSQAKRSQAKRHNGTPILIKDSKQAHAPSPDIKPSQGKQRQHPSQKKTQ
jgi:hypothetical protein